MMVDCNAVALEALNEAIEQFELSFRRQRLHDTRLVCGGDYQASFGHHQQIATGLSILVFGNPVEKIVFLHVDDASQNANGLPGRVTQGNGNDDQRNLEHTANDRSANDRAPFAQHNLHIIAIAIADAGPSEHRRHRGDRHAVGPSGEGAAVEKLVDIPPAFKVRLHGRRTGLHGRACLIRHLFQATNPVREFMIDLIRHQRHRRELLFSQQMHHVTAQIARGIESQRPDAGNENGQRHDDNFGFQRTSRRFQQPGEIEQRTNHGFSTQIVT